MNISPFPSLISGLLLDLFFFITFTKSGVAAGSRVIVVSASECGSCLGFESHQNRAGFSQPWPAPTQSWECYGPSGKAGTTKPSFIHFTGASLRGCSNDLTNTAGAAVPGPGSHRDNYDRKLHGLWPCQVVKPKLTSIVSSSWSVSAQFFFFKEWGGFSVCECFVTG